MPCSRHSAFIGLLLLAIFNALACYGFASESSRTTRLHRFHHLNTHQLKEKTFRRLTGIHADQVVQDCEKNADIVEDWFVQNFDHFNDTGSGKFQQRYFVNRQYFNTSLSNGQPVVFLMLGGEGEMTKKWVCWENYTYMQMAKEHGAVVVQLEHRFFGKNKNMTDLSTPNLVYLTTEQALADAATFIREWPGTQKDLDGARWVAFGGSYPGSLAAWLRQKYPDVTVGNVASSAPLWPKANFWEYSDVMEKTINATSADCYANVGKAFAELKVATLSDSGRSRITNLFRLKPALTTNVDDITSLLGAAFGAFQGIIQYTYDGRRQANMDGLDIGTACRIMNNASTPELLERLAEVFWLDATLDLGLDRNDSFDVRYQENLEPFKLTDIDAPGASMRGWLWLSCNEFGWLQTTDKGNSLFGDIISIGSNYKLCQDLFGPEINSARVERRVAKAEGTFGTSWQYNATNVILPNGAFDPWSALGTDVTIEEQHQITVLTAGAAHCSDMYPAYPGEPAALAVTRQKVMDEVRYYLESTENAANAVGMSLVMMGATVMIMLIFG